MVKISRVVHRSHVFCNKLKVQHADSVLLSQHVSLYCAQTINEQIDGKTFNGEEVEQDVSIRNIKNTHELQENALQEVIKQSKSLSNSEWNTIRESVLNMGSVINEKNIDGFIMRCCVILQSFACGKSYLKYLSSSTSSPFNLSVIKNFFWLCYVCRSSCTDKDLSDIDNMYEYIKTNYPILDANTAECIVMGLSVTKHWKDYTKYFEIIQETCTPSSHVYSAVIEAAFLNSDFELGWQLMEEMVVNDKKPTDNVYNTWLQITNKRNVNVSLEMLFKFLSNYDIKLPKSLAVKVKETFDSNRPIGKHRIGSAFTSITTRGMCKNCRVSLSQIALTTHEFNTLRNAFLNPVLTGKDIFLKTRPEEFSEYQKFLERTSPYDIALDGLNIAYSANARGNAKSFSFLVKSVVSHFVKEGKKVLVLGRKHMDRWPLINMKYIYDNASVFLADDLSQDDPFLLYAAMYSGQHTHFMSRDLMRGHTFLLQDPTLKILFKRWQTQHQYFLVYVDNNGKVTYRPPHPFSLSAQHSHNGAWHIPIEEEKKGKGFSIREQYYSVYNNWLCLRRF